MDFSIFNYTDYQKALSDFYYGEKERNSVISHRYIAQKMGFSAGFFSQVISGKSNISEKNIPKFAKLLKLNIHEAAYFETLVLYNQAKIPETKKLYFEKLSAFNPEQVADFGENDYLFYDKWYYSAILELLDFFPFGGENYAELAQTLYPVISVLEAQQAIEMLQGLGLIKKERERYVKTNRLLTTSNPNQSKTVTRYAQHMINQGKNTIELLDADVRNISWLTMSISDENYPVLVDEIRAFRRKIMQLASSDTNASRVYQMNLQLFPLSESYPGNPEKEPEAES